MKRCIFCLALALILSACGAGFSGGTPACMTTQSGPAASSLPMIHVGQ